MFARWFHPNKLAKSSRISPTSAVGAVKISLLIWHARLAGLDATPRLVSRGRQPGGKRRQPNHSFQLEYDADIAARRSSPSRSSPCPAAPGPLASTAPRWQRAAQFDQAARERMHVAAPHLPFPGVGHLRAEGEGYAWVPLPYRDRQGK